MPAAGDKTQPSFESLPPLDQKILYYIHKAGPVFITKLAKRLNRDVESVRQSVGRLKNHKYLERVGSPLVEYRLGKRSKVTKHRNHTYFDLTRKGRLLFRDKSIQIKVNLRPPYKQA